MGGLLTTKKKSVDGKKVKVRAGKNNPRNSGSTMSLPEESSGGVSATPNPYTKDGASRQPNRNGSDPGVPFGNAATLGRPVPPKPSKPKLPVVKAIYDYTSRYADDMSFQKGDRMEIVTKGDNDDWWLVRNMTTKKEGHVPSNYVVDDNNTIETQEWWFGSDRRGANKQLMLPGNVIGTFLIRNSKEKKAYALSLLDKDDKEDFVIRHFLIRKMDNGGCYIHASKTFTDLFQLIEYYSENNGLKRRLTQVCPKQALAVPFKEIEVKRTEIVIGEKLGAGNFGEVHSGTFRNVVDVAVKSLKPGGMTTQEFLEEAETMHKLRHPKLVQLMGVCTQGEPLWIITERMAHGALIDFLRSNMGSTVQFPTMIDMAAQISDGMSYLEAKNYIHRDLRAANILVAENFVVKVADFGLARILDGIYEGDDDIYKGSEKTKFPIKWTAPEAATDLKFSIKSDVWSFGILLYELVTFGRIPYPEMDNTTTLDRVIKGYRMPKPVCCPDELYDIMLQCWEAKPEKRPTFEHLKGVFEDFQVSTEPSYTLDDL